MDSGEELKLKKFESLRPTVDHQAIRPSSSKFCIGKRYKTSDLVALLDVTQCLKSGDLRKIC